jgi:hypothetical protein
MKTSQAGFAAVVEEVRAVTGLTEREAKLLLERVADALVRQALLRQVRVVWPRLGTFRPFTQQPRAVQLVGLKGAGHLHRGAPDAARIDRMRKLRFRPSKIHALLKGVR